jgi:Ca-activated chloride channel family protein
MPDRRKSYYALLGILRDASQEEIRRAYFEAARRLHPDTNKAAGETELFLEIQQAYEVLASPQRRAQYDATLPAENETLESVVDCSVQYSRPNLVRITEPQLIYVLLELEQRRTGEKPLAPPLNLCLLLDRSTSMGGEKLDLAKAATLEIIRNLRPDDIFSVVAFADHPDVLLPASFQSDRSRLSGRIQSLHAGGSTEMFQGLSAAIEEIRRAADGERINHLILLTDGHTYGDEQNCLALATEASRENIGISGFGIGTEWNDIFLDALAAKSGNNSTYISEPKQIQRLLVQKFEALTSTYAEDVLLEPKPADGVVLSHVFRLQPHSAPVSLEKTLHLGPVLQQSKLSVLIELLIEPSAVTGSQLTLLEGVIRLVLPARRAPESPIRINLEREVASAPRDDPPPTAILDALSRFTLYRLQERARQEAEAQEYDAATRHLRNLAALLLTQGEKDLAQTALLEAEQTQKMQALSKEGGKAIKYGTRALVELAAERFR